MYTSNADEFPVVRPEEVMQTTRSFVSAVAYTWRGAAIWPRDVRVTIRPAANSGSYRRLGKDRWVLPQDVIVLVAPGTRPEIVVSRLRSLAQIIDAEGLYAGCTSDGEVVMTLPDHGESETAWRELKQKEGRATQAALSADASGYQFEL